MTATITDHDITASVFANILRVIEEATHEDDGSLSEEAQEEIDDYLQLLGADGMPELRHLLASEERLSLEALSHGDEWTAYRGPHGGKGWMNTRTGEVVYGDEKPGRNTVAEKVGYAAGKKVRALGAAVLHEMKPSSILERIKQAASAVAHPIETVRKVKAKAVEKYKALEERYGRPGAIAIVGAYAGYYVAFSINPMLTMTYVPSPTAVLLGSAEALRFASKKVGETVNPSVALMSLEDSESSHLLHEAKAFIGELAEAAGEPMPELDDDVLSQVIEALLQNAGDGEAEQLAQGDDPWQPYQGKRGGKGWKNAQTGRIVYGANKPGGSHRASAKKAPMTARQVLDHAKKVMQSPTREGALELINNLAGLKLADMRKVRDALGGAKGGRSKADIQERVKQAVEGQVPVKQNAAPKASKAKPATKPPSKLAKPSSEHTDTAHRVIKSVAGKHNLASLADVRDALAKEGVGDRAQQDAAIHELRRKGVLSASGYEGRHGISDREQEAALQDGKTRLGYLSLRNPSAKPKASQAKPSAAHASFLSTHTAGIDSHPNLSPEQKQKYKASMSRAVQHMPEAALSRMKKVGLDKVHFAQSREHWGDEVTKFYADYERKKAARLPEDRRPSEAEINAKARQRAAALPISGEVGKNLKGFYLGEQDAKDSMAVFLDGDTEGEDDVAGAKRTDNMHEVYAHELTHAIDGPDHEHSSSPEWQSAFAAEINHTPETVASGKAKLSEYATNHPGEGFAEFGRLLYATDMDLAKIEKQFPQCSAFFKSKGLWPASRAAGSRSELGDVFNERVELPNGGHGDAFVPQTAGASPAVPTRMEV